MNYSGRCYNAFCGDGYYWSGHDQCEDGDSSNNNACVQNPANPKSCSRARCGDGHIWNEGIPPTDYRYEECDDGNFRADDGCIHCELAYCGDYDWRRDITNPLDPNYEECDMGPVDNDVCLSTCLKPYCGDGYLHSNDDCEDGDFSNNNACVDDPFGIPGQFNTVPYCRVATCGDGYVWNEGILPTDPRYEECDDGNTRNGDGCSSACENEP